ncbi:M1 family metallopeptidase [Chitinophagaceae bacterium LB-8]|uniref:M1 family metallopeptidase n=2 Tax=Paraflavisolibacter caeni TaxID=2982496 RepID=A0A9X3B917_9BACT|nr:M1 family metallopeptidase [Paraflavisolibacter caeni]
MKKVLPMPISSRLIPYPLMLFTCILFVIQTSCAQPLNKKEEYSNQDSLRGSITRERAWWDVVSYDIAITPDFTNRSIEGKNDIQFKVTAPGDVMQIDLQHPMDITKVTWRGKGLSMTRNGNVYHITFPSAMKPGSIEKVTIEYKGKPRIANNPPWDGGWIFTKDKLGRPWMSVACQGLGASVWYPCKDHQSDEPDSASISIEVPDTLVAVANGQLAEQKSYRPGMTTYKWTVRNPINNYNIIPYIGKYINWTETYQGEKGPLACSYWVLDYNESKARKQFSQGIQTLKALEYWFGPYPFYEDGYKLVESPHLGMEHQSAVAYGNGYINGYKGQDLSGTGWGLKWDYIIVHESGHEWFGNNITTKDIADMWVHEGFTDYSETLFTEYYYGKEAGATYIQGLRKNILNDKPIIGKYGINQEGSGDMYYKGANLVHTIRQIINDDNQFRSILRGLNKEFYHQTVTTKQVENYINKQSGKDFSKTFDQYLRTTQVPTLELKIDDSSLKYKWSHCISGFNMPVKLSNGLWLYPTTEWRKLKTEEELTKGLSADKNFYISVKRL